MGRAAAVAPVEAIDHAVYCHRLTEASKASIHLSGHFEKFVKEQIARGQFQNASEIVRAGLRLLEERETSIQERAELMKAKINEAWDDPRPSLPAEDVFARLEARHAKPARRSKNDRA